MSPSERARIAALTRHAFGDTKAAVAPARRGFEDKFRELVDPDGVLPAAEREIRAQRLLQAHMVKLAARSAAARAKRATR